MVKVKIIEHLLVCTFLETISSPFIEQVLRIPLHFELVQACIRRISEYVIQYVIG
jgi:hypothetical protein